MDPQDLEDDPELALALALSLAEVRGFLRRLLLGGRGGGATRSGLAICSDAT
jgi:hypothetical protein